MSDDNTYYYNLGLVLAIKNVEDEDEAAEYASDFIIGLNDYISSSDENDDHYEINKWFWMN